MPLQNRVTPFGEIVAVAARGTLMGNRGCLHGDQQRLVRTHASRQDWVTCRLQFKDRRRPLMAPGKYTELFFLDEVTALAAGHRPCNECRNERFREFKAAWLAGVEGREGGTVLVTQIDPVMQADRLAGRNLQRRHVAQLGDLPGGVMVQLDSEHGIAHLKWRGQLLRWQPDGYDGMQPVDANVPMTVLTPACTVKVLAAGYVPEVHTSAREAFLGAGVRPQVQEFDRNESQ